MATLCILALLATFSSTALLVSSQEETTYVHTLSSGQQVVCKRCEPGFYLQAHCTDTKQTLCRQCSEGFYTEYYNYVRACLPCNYCSPQQVLKRACSSSRNSVCECKEGYYWQAYTCRRHTQCARGYGIKEHGTAYKDTVCEHCLSGYYAAGKPGNKRCVPHTACTPGEKILFQGNHFLDNVCYTCESIADKGWVTLIRPMLLELFKTCNSRKLQRFLKRSNFVHNNQVVQTSSDSDDLIEQWLNAATAEQLMDLPKMLNMANLHCLLKKLELRIARIQEELKFCSNNITDSL